MRACRAGMVLSESSTAVLRDVQGNQSPDIPGIPDANMPEVNQNFDIGMQQTTICDLWNSGIFQICTNCHGNSGGVRVDHTSPRTLHDSFVNVAGNSNSTSSRRVTRKALICTPKCWVRRTSSPVAGAGACLKVDRITAKKTLRPLLRWINSDNLAACLP